MPFQHWCIHPNWTTIRFNLTMQLRSQTLTRPQLETHTFHDGATSSVLKMAKTRTVGTRCGTWPSSYHSAWLFRGFVKEKSSYNCRKGSHKAVSPSDYRDVRLNIQITWKICTLSQSETSWVKYPDIGKTSICVFTAIWLMIQQKLFFPKKKSTCWWRTPLRLHLSEAALEQQQGGASALSSCLLLSLQCMHTHTHTQGNAYKL